MINTTNLQFLASLFEGILIKRLNSNQIVGLENKVARIDGQNLAISVDRNSKTRVLTERRRPWDAEKIAVELYGSGEGWKDTVK